jgi:hypothetical protein
MTEGFAIALLTVLGGMATAALNAFLGRSRINRLEAVSRVLKDLPVHDPSYADLARVREEDAREIRRAQMSPWPILIGFSLAAIFFGFLYSEFGEDIRDWSEWVYGLLLGSVLGSFLGAAILYAAFIIAWLVRTGQRIFGWVKAWWRERLEQRRPQAPKRQRA